MKASRRIASWLLAAVTVACLLDVPVASAAHTERTAPPDTSSRYYYDYSCNPFYTERLWTWCTWYAYGRAYEILGEKPDLSLQAASKWYRDNITKRNSGGGYPYSGDYYSAKVGAVACYANHVQIVERVGSDGAPAAFSTGGYGGTSGSSAFQNKDGWKEHRRFKYGVTYAEDFIGYIYITDDVPAGAAGGSDSRPAVTAAVTTSAAQSVTDTSAVLYGSFVSKNARATEVGMYLGTTQSNMTRLGSDSVSSYGLNMWYSTEKYGRPLEPATKYYCCAYAVVDGETYKGNVVSFTTAGETQAASIRLDRDTLTMQDNVCNTLKAATTPAGQAVSWRSSDPSVAAVEDGMVTGLRAGTATITASMTYGGRTYSDTCRVTVTPAYGITLSETSLSIRDGESVQLSASTTPEGRHVYWESSDTDVAVISSSGRLLGRNAGEATITAYFNEGSDTYTAACSVTVTPSVERASVSIPVDSITLAEDAYEVLQADVVPGHRAVTWTSSDPAVAAVDNGIVTAVSPGTAVITASLTYNGVTSSDSCTVTVERAEEALAAPVLTVSATQITAGETFRASWTRAASDAVYYANISGRLATGDAYMSLGADTTALSTTLGADWEPGTYEIHIVARNDHGQIKSNVVTVEVAAPQAETPDPANSTLQITGLKLPTGDIKGGDKISLAGMVRSNYAISEIWITVYDTQTGACIYDQSYPGDGSLTHFLGSDLAPAVQAANYISSFSICVGAADVSGKSVTQSGAFRIVG